MKTEPKCKVLNQGYALANVVCKFCSCLNFFKLYLSTCHLSLTQTNVWIVVTWQDKVEGTRIATLAMAAVRHVLFWEVEKKHGKDAYHTVHVSLKWYLLVWMVVFLRYNSYEMILKLLYISSLIREFLTQLPLQPHIRVHELGKHWFRYRLVTCSASDRLGFGRGLYIFT